MGLETKIKIVAYHLCINVSLVVSLNLDCLGITNVMPFTWYEKQTETPLFTQSE